jgi:hypothetical protein
VTFFEELDRKIAQLGLLIGIPIPAAQQGWSCDGCRHTWDDPVEGFFAADTIGGLMFVIEFAVCGVCRREGGAGAE